MTWRRRTPQPSATARGYGTWHRWLRAWWDPQVQAGGIDCHADICLEERDGNGRRIKPGTPWHLGHTEDRTGWTGPEHARCNIADGARRGGRASLQAQGRTTPPRRRASRNW